MIGVEVMATNDLGGAFGVSGSSFGDTQAQAQAVADHINKSGGIAGRPLEVVFHASDYNSRSWPENAQAACATFTEDHTVFAAVSAGHGSTELPACLAAKSTPLVAEHRWNYDDVVLRQLAGYVYLPSRMSATRWAGPYVNELLAAGFFPDGSHVGIVRVDDEVEARVVKDIARPALERAGLQIEEAVVSQVNSVDDTGVQASQISNAILRFRSSGVNRVLFFEPAGSLAFFFTNAAESQGYRPKYGFTSTNAPQFNASNVPAAQLEGSVGLGWLPAEDVYAPQDPHDGPGRRLCDDIMRSAGMRFGGPENRFAQASAYSYCEGLLFLREAAERSPELSAPGLTAGVRQLERSFDSPMTFWTDFGGGRSDGPAVVRVFRFDTRCRCYVYASADRSVQ